MVVRIASYNTALSRDTAGELLAAIRSGKHQQVLATIKLLQHIRPDVVLLNEVDYDATGETVRLLQQALNSSVTGSSPLDLPYSFCQPVNTGVPSGRDFDKDGVASDKGADALGFGSYPGHYGMMLLSRYPIDESESRTFQHFLWRDMPSAVFPKHPNGQSWFDTDDLAVLPLSSKSHWDVAVQVEGKSLRCLCSHPTPPVFDGKEGRNRCRNQSEIRFWTDYLSDQSYFYDDQGRVGGFGHDSPFVLLGDLNASPWEGESNRAAIKQLLSHPYMADIDFPVSQGAIKHSPKLPSSISQHHTAVWRMPADYVRPSRLLTLQHQAVFWPSSSCADASLLKNTSDHRLVFIDCLLPDSKKK